MTVTQSWNVKYRIVEIKSSEKDGKPYYFIPLPEEVSELGIEIGDIVKLDDEFDEEPRYIQCCKTERETIAPSEGYYVIWDYGGPHLTIPKRWDQLLKEPVSYAVVEINRLEDPPHLRIYDNEDFYSRVDELINKEGVGIGDPLLRKIVLDPSDQRDEAIDLASRPPFPGQRFRLVPVEPDFEPLIQAARDRENKKRVCINSDHVASVTQNHRIPAIHADEIAITWHTGVPTLEDIETLQTQTTYDEAKVILRDHFTEETEVILPKHGTFKIWGLSSGWKGYNWVTYLSEELVEHGVPYGNTVTPEWGANFFDSSESDDSCIALYLPIPFIQKGTPDVWWA